VVELLNQDCMIYMSSLPDKAFELAIVDPPYGIGADEEQNKAAMSRIRANGKSKAGRGWKLYAETQWDKSIPQEDYWIELFRVSENQIVWGGNYMTEYLSPSMGWVFWDKGQRDFSLADGELAWTSFDRALRVFSYSRARALQDGRIHPTQKPVALYRWLLKNYAKAGDRILDTHLGSASSAIAAHQMGFDMVGLEIDKEYFEAAQKRFKEQTAQLALI